MNRWGFRLPCTDMLDACTKRGGDAQFLRRTHQRGSGVDVYLPGKRGMGVTLRGDDRRQMNYGRGRYVGDEGLHVSGLG